MIAQDKQLIGHTLDDRYEIIECLGSGGMGVVYKARQKGLDRSVAIKMPHLENISSSTSRSRFEREARTMAKFSHENIVQVYDYNAESKRPFIVLEYVEGRELAELLTESDKISIEGVLSVCRQIARGLDYAHRHGVIHRDIKPENIVISDKRRCVKIMDFGLVRLEDGNSQDTRAGFVVGTPQYMSPEQVRAHPVGPASDIYALAIILYCIFTGRLPFEGEGMALMMRHATEAPPNPLDVNPYLPKTVGDALLRSLEKKPEARHQSATAFVDEIAAGIAKYREYSYASLLRGDFREENRLVTGKLALKQPYEDSPAERTWRPPGMGDPVPPSPTEPLETAGVFWAGSLATNGQSPHPLLDKLKAAGQTVKKLKTVRETLEQAHQQSPSLLVVAGALEDGSGPALCRLWRAQESTSDIPILFIGDRQQLTAPARSDAATLEVVSPDTDPDETAEVALGILARAASDTAQKALADKVASSESSGNFVTDMITRLDRALLSEAVTSRLIASRLRGENLRQTFQEIGQLIRPFFPYRFLYAAFAPEKPGGKGVLILDKTDPEGNSDILSAVLMRIHSEVKRAARGHKDVPKDYDLVFAKERTTMGGGVTEQSIMSVDDNFIAFPIEEGASFYGAFGMCGPGDPPTGQDADKLAEIVNPAYHALSNAWQTRQAEKMRKLDPSGVWRRDNILEYLRLSLNNSESLKEPFSLILIDIDKLDHLNETYGMGRCDQLLVQIGKIVTEASEGQARAGRLGSDEFLLVLPGYTIGETMKIAATLHKKIRAIRLSAAPGDEGLPIKTSVGVAYRGQTERSPDQMMRAARNALGAVKSSGGDGIRAAG